MILNTPVGRRDIPDEIASKSGLLKQFLAEARTHEVNLSGRFLESEGVLDSAIAFLEGKWTPKEGENDERIFNMILAADYLQIPDLMEMYIAKVRQVLENSRSADEVRKAFHITKDLSNAEELSASRENPWEDEFDLVEGPPPSSDLFLSVMVDGKSQFRTATADSMYGSPSLRGEMYDIVKFVQPRRPITPIPDEHAPTCSNCKVLFSPYIRRHHCRRCGMYLLFFLYIVFLKRMARLRTNYTLLFGFVIITSIIGRVYCYSCSSKSIRLPENMNVYQGYSSPYTRVKSWVGSWYTETKPIGSIHRVCFFSVFPLLFVPVYLISPFFCVFVGV